MKKLLATAVVLGVAMIATSAYAEGNKIGYTCMDGTNPFFVALEAALRPRGGMPWFSMRLPPSPLISV